MKKVTKGLYFLYNGDELVYIGKSSNIFSRVGQHIRENIKMFDNWNYKIIENDKERDEMEGYLIEIFKPKYNQKGEPNSIFDKDKQELLKSDLYSTINGYKILTDYNWVPIKLLDDVFGWNDIGIRLYHMGYIPEDAVNREIMYGYTRTLLINKEWAIKNLKHLHDGFHKYLRERM